MIGECAWCGGPLSSSTAVTNLGPWLTTHELYRTAMGSLADKMPVWCGIPCREASGSPSLGALVYPDPA